ncbi:MAG TPA: O-sialoglycoprotein endopeptidase, partial [Clostridia bacterium]|nr:O-sialoglycoprotein endopeptidase [Clostridia bacterium]
MSVCVLGIDTSCYTTSVALVSSGIIFDKRILLQVPKGSRGLRQSEAVFLHINNLPSIFDDVR